MAKPVCINRGTYTMEMPNKETATLVMYGEIVESRPVDWWTGEPVEGDFIIQDELLKDLESIKGAKTVSIRMNSLGGDAYASILIHNRLREMASAGTKISCIVDGCAMSGGSLIMCACDDVKVNPGSIIMIHQCICALYGGYQAKDLKEVLASCEAVDKSQVAIYKRKTGQTDTVLLHMMANTTYMTGSEAVEKGFADELIEDAEPLAIAASADGRSLFVRGREMHLAPGMFAPDTIPTVTPEAKAPDGINTNQPEIETGGQNGGNTMAQNLEELREENPALADQLMAEARAAVSASGTPEIVDAVQAERQRIADIDALAGLYDAETVQEAKYGENPCTAQEMTFRAAQKAAAQGRKFLSDLKEDGGTSGVQNVGAVPPPAEGETNSVEQARADARAFNESKKEVR